MEMPLAHKIAALLVALEGGYELVTKSKHTILMSESGEPGIQMYRRDMTPREELFQVGSETVYMMIVDHAKVIDEHQIKAIEETFR